MDDHKKFLKLLAKDINRGPDKFSFETLKTYLLEAVNVLPDGNLKNSLQKQSKENADYLWNLIKPLKKQSAEIEFTIFNKNTLDETLNKIVEHESFKEQTQYLSQAALCYPCSKVFESLLTAQKKQNPIQSQLEVLSNVMELCGRLTVGCQNSKVLNELMQVFLSEIDKITDKFKTSNETKESWLDLKDVTHNFLIHCHVKRKMQEKGSPKDNMIKWKEFRDVLAALIAIYIDVIIAIGEINENINDHICNMVYLLLGDSLSHILDAANQIFTLDSRGVKMIFPFLRKVFETTRKSTTEYTNYIKYVSLAWKVQRCDSNCEEEKMILRKCLCSLSPPEDFLSCLTEVDNSLIQDFELSGLAGVRITNKILECEDEEKIEKILDLATSPEKWKQMTENLHENDAEDIMNENESDVPLFFVDAHGSTELLEECQEQEFTNTTSDKMLKTQIKALLEKREESEDEKDDFDITFDDNEATFEYDFAEPEAEDTNEIVSSQSIQLEDDGTERVSETENVVDIVKSPERDEGLTRSGKKRRKRKSKTPSAISEEVKVKSPKKKVLRKRRSSLKNA